MKWYLYVLECENDAFYTGITDDLKRRFSEHFFKKGGAYTKRNKPRVLAYTEIFDEKSLAKDREKQIKRWSRAKKKALINGDFSSLRKLSISRERDKGIHQQ